MYFWVARSNEKIIRKPFSKKTQDIILLLLVFSVTPFKIDQNKNHYRSIEKVQNLGKKRR